MDHSQDSKLPDENKTSAVTWRYDVLAMDPLGSAPPGWERVAVLFGCFVVIRHE